jgi:hypothetical protein
MNEIIINKTDIKNLIGYIHTVLDLVDTESMEYENAEIIHDGYDDFVEPIIKALKE